VCVCREREREKIEFNCKNLIVCKLDCSANL